MMTVDLHTIRSSKSKVKGTYSVHGKLTSDLHNIICHTGSQCYLPPDTSERAPP